MVGEVGEHLKEDGQLELSVVSFCVSWHNCVYVLPSLENLIPAKSSLST